MNSLSFLTFSSVSFSNLTFTFRSGYSELEQKVSDLSKISCLNANECCSLRKAFQLSSRYTVSAWRMQSFLAKVPKESLQVFLKQLEIDDAEQLDVYLERSLNLLEDKSLLEFFNDLSIKGLEELFQLQGLIKETALKNGLDKEGQSLRKQFFIEAKHFLHNVLGNMIAVLGINELIRKKIPKYGGGGGELDAYMANNKLETYMKLLSYPLIIFGLIYSYIEFMVPAAVITLTAVACLVVALIAYEKYWKPCPVDYPGLTNLSIDRLSENEPVYPRKDILEQIENSFRAKKGVLLVGEPGVGKSYLIKSFTEQLSAGKSCAFIKDPQVFSCNASEFSTFGNSLSSIQDDFKKYKNTIVFFFDEFHALFKENQSLGNASGEQIKTFCEDFKYVIGATTAAEYEIFLKDKPAILHRRFNVVTVPSMTSQEMERSLRHYLEEKNWGVPFDQDVISYIVERAPEFNKGTSLIDAAQSLLNSAIEKVTSISDGLLERKVIALEEGLLWKEREISNLSKFDDLDEKIQTLKKKKEELSIAKKEQAIQKLWEQRLRKIEDYYRKLKQEGYKLSDSSLSLFKDLPLLRKYLQVQVRIKIVEELLDRGRAVRGLPFCLNKKLIDQILATRS